MSAAYPKRSAQHLAAREAFFEFHIVAGKHILRKWLQDPRLIHSVSWTKPNGCCDLRLTTMCSWNHVFFTALNTVCLQTAIIHATMSVHRVVLCFSRLRCQGVWKLALHVLADVRGWNTWNGNQLAADSCSGSGGSNQQQVSDSTTPTWYHHAGFTTYIPIPPILQGGCRP